MNKYEIVICDRRSFTDRHTGVYIFLENEEAIPIQIEFSTAETAFLLKIVKWNVN